MTSTSISGFQPRFCPRVGGVDALVRNLPTSSFVEHSSRWQRSGDEKKNFSGEVERDSSGFATLDGDTLTCETSRTRHLN